MAGPTLLIGGMGFIGLHTARRFLDQGQDVVLTYHANRREPDFLQKDLGTRARVEQLDVRDADRVADIIKTHDVEGVVYLAVPALANVSPAEEFQTNTQGYLNVLEASRAAGIRRLTVTSSVAIYSNVEERPWREDQTVSTSSTNPTEAYKKALEVLGLYFGTRTGLDVVMLRIAGIFGPLYHSMANLPSRLAHGAANGRAPDFNGMRYGPPKADDGGDSTYVKDCAIGIQLAHMAPKLEHRVYNVGSGKATRNQDLVDAIREMIPEFQAELPPGGNADNKYMDISRISSELGYTPATGPLRGVVEYVEWLRSHPQ
ncbi:MAG TPA: NAD(P)-dependent oxidoreductase [Chloroflexota bacterium]|jgi:UDP-glucose 4-epimerase|nr:NAD(P)-dependent oxidoreductase [Chloroflexota bacterium]